MSSPRYDCLVAGAGPAGAHCAAVLASWGRRVLLVGEPRPPHKPPAETLVASARFGFERRGLGTVFQTDRWRGTARHGVIWGSENVVWREERGAAKGRRLPRLAFDAALVEQAVESGAEVRHGWRVTGALRPGSAIELRSPEGARESVLAELLVNATGRPDEDAPVVRSGLRTVALWTSVADAGPHGNDTVVEAVADGWLWWLPLAEGGACLTLFADLDEMRQRGRDSLFAAALADSRGPARAAAPGPARGTVCTALLPGPAPGLLRCGDAACSIDPLASQGVEKALASAEDCAFVANTWLESPELRASLERHRDGWEAQLFEAHSRDAARFYLLEGRFTDAPYWSRRHLEARRLLASADAPLPPGRLAPADTVRKATSFERRGRQVVATPGLRASADGPSLRRLGPVDVAALLEHLPATPEEAVERARRDARFAAASPSAVRSALAELHRLGFVSPQDRAADTR